MLRNFLALIQDAGLNYVPIYFFLGSGALAWALLIGGAIKLWIDTIQRNRLIGLIAQRRLAELREQEIQMARHLWPREVAQVEDELAAVRNGLGRAVYRNVGQEADLATRKLP